MTTPNDEQIDLRLREWHSGLHCDDAVHQRMLAQILQQVGESKQEVFVNLPESTVGRTGSRSRFLTWTYSGFVAACIGGFTAWLWWPDRSIDQANSRPIPAEVAQVVVCRFTPEELRRTEKLVCELDHVFENQLQLIHQRDRQLDFDFTNQPIDAMDAPRLLLRFVLQQRLAGTAWTAVQCEEVIGGQDHQFAICESIGITVQYWSHLLPDDSLWAEVAISTDAADRVTNEFRCTPNQPQVVWNRAEGEKQTQLLLIYELLNPCQAGVI